MAGWVAAAIVGHPDGAYGATQLRHGAARAGILSDCDSLTCQAAYLPVMNSKIQEDSRTLREFYPDPAARHRMHYDFAHRFLPHYVQQNPHAFFSYLYRRDLPGGPVEPTRFIQSRWAMFEEHTGWGPRPDDSSVGGLVFRRVTDLAMTTQEVAGKPVALVQMPVPERPVEVYFVAVALLASPTNPEGWPRDIQARVFTLEAGCSEPPGEGQSGVVCEWTKEGTHRNFGVAVGAHRAAFLQAVRDVLQTPDAPDAGGYTPPTNGESATITLRLGGDSPPSSQSALETKRPWWKFW